MKGDRNPFDQIQWFLNTNDSTIVFLRELVSPIAVVLLVGAILFTISGLWPPMVAIESGSMEPEIYRGDLIFIVEEHRYTPEIDHGTTGVVTYRTGEDHSYRTYDSYGDVIVYRPYGDASATPVIHRARFWVNASENWHDKANPDYVAGENCVEIPNCPAPHAGFITKGDANNHYDQVERISTPVRPAWVVGTAEIRVPYLGYIRLSLS